MTPSSSTPGSSRSLAHKVFLAYVTVLAAAVGVTALAFAADTTGALWQMLADRELLTQESFGGSSARFWITYLSNAVSPVVGVVLLTVVALVIAWGLREAEGASTLALLLLVPGAVLGVVFFPSWIRMGGQSYHYYDETLYVITALTVGAGAILMVPAALRFSVLFPRRVGIDGGAESASSASTLTRLCWREALGLRLPLWILSPGLLAGALLVFFDPPVIAWTLLFSLSALGLAAAVSLNLVSALRSASGAATRRLGWALTLLVCAIVALPPTSTFVLSSGARLLPDGFLGPQPSFPVTVLVINSLPLLGLTALAFLTIFGAGAVDRRFAVKRTLLYGTLALGGVFGFGVLQTAFADRMLQIAGFSEGIGSLLASGLLAVAFKPVHDFLERWIDRWLGPG